MEIKLLHDAKRALVYGYGNDGKITIQKRILGQTEDMDIIDALENGDIVIENSTSATTTIPLSCGAVDEDALLALDKVLKECEANS